MQLIAVSLIGIPASGKSSIAKRILDLSRNHSLEASVIVISFDEHIQLNFTGISEGLYKTAREELMMKVEDLLKKLTEGSPLELKDEQLSIQPDGPSLVILDDNNFYRSMRQRVRSICKTVQCQHVQIFMKSSLEDAVGRNRQRPEPVPDSIIEKMFNQIETPVNHRTIIIENLDIEDKTLCELLKERIKHPETFEEPAESTVQQQSIIHEIDILTRKELSLRIQAIKSKPCFTQSCEIMNRRRKEFLEELRTRNLGSEDINSLLKAFHCYLDR